MASRVRSLVAIFHVAQKSYTELATILTSAGSKLLD